MIDKPLPRHAMALAGGGLVPLAFAPFNLWWLLPLAMMAPMLLWQHDRPRQGFLHGWLFGFAMFGIGLAWIRVSIGIYGNIHSVLAMLLTLALAALLAFYPALVGALACSRRQLSPAQRQLLWIPALWLLSEWLRARCFGGFSWLSPGYSQIDSPLAALLPLGGTPMVLAVLAISSGLLVLALGNRGTRRHRCIVAVAALWLLPLALAPVQWTKEDSGHYSVALVQGAIPQELKWNPEHLQHTKDLYRQLSAPLWPDTDLVLWPEAVIPAFQHQITPYLAYLDSARRQATLMLGIPTHDRHSGALHNSMMALGDDGGQRLPGIEQMYHKQHLVPFGEYLPFASLLAPVFDKLGIPYSDFSSGSGTGWLHTPMGPAGIMICYEVIFAHTVRHKLPTARILVNVSNDAWFGDSTGPHQHLQIARTRARESGRFLLRATNNGISAVIDPHAKVLAQSQQFKSEVVRSQVVAMAGATPYVSFGDAPAVLLALALLLLLWWRPRHSA